MMDLAAGAHLPPERDDTAELVGGHDAGLGVGDLQAELDRRAGLAGSENFTGLRTTVSGGSRPPPQVAAFDPRHSRLGANSATSRSTSPPMAASSARWIPRDRRPP